MGRVDTILGKKTSRGHSRKHNAGKAGGTSGPWSRKAQATKRTWKVNLKEVKLNINGTVKRERISMKLYKKLKGMKELNPSNVYSKDGMLIKLA
jgi:ribosomal protein L28